MLTRQTNAQLRDQYLAEARRVAADEAMALRTGQAIYTRRSAEFLQRQAAYFAEQAQLENVRGDRLVAGDLPARCQK
jgi:hypothetical protein